MVLGAVAHADVWEQAHYWTGDAGVLRWRSKVTNGLIPTEPQVAWIVRDLSRVVGDVLVRAQGSGHIHRRRTLWRI